MVLRSGGCRLGIYFALVYSQLTVVLCVDLIVPLFSFTNCFLSLILIFRSLRYCESWSKAYHLKPAELLDEYISSSVWLEFRRWFPYFSKLISEIEFHILHDVFCEHYSVQRKAFAFDEYAGVVYERYIQQLIELRLIHWVVFFALLMFVWLPNSVFFALSKCRDHGLDEHLCADNGSIVFLVIAGCALLFVTLCFAIAARRYELVLIHQSGVTCVDDYPAYLQVMDSAPENVVERKRMGEDELKNVIKAAMEDAARQSHEPKWIRNLRLWASGVSESFWSICKSNRTVAPIDGAFSEDELKVIINASFKNAMKSTKSSSPVPQSEQQAASSSSDERRETPFLSNSHKRDARTFHRRTNQLQMKQIFFLQTPLFFFEGVQMLLLPISLYCAIWMVQFAVLHVHPYWKAVSVIICAVTITVFMYVVHTAALLKVISLVHYDWC